MRRLVGAVVQREQAQRVNLPEVICTCPECDKPVRAIKGEMFPSDLSAIRSGKRPQYALHACCANGPRR